MDDAPGSRRLIRLALIDSKTPEDNLLAATQLVRVWPLRMQGLKDDPLRSIYAWVEYDDGTPSIMNMDAYVPTQAEMDAITTLDGTPLAIR
jgi:hypothetical protein